MVNDDFFVLFFHKTWFNCFKSIEERQRIAQERDEINAKINEQNQLLQEREEEKRQFEAELARVRAMHEAEMDHFSEQKQESDG